MKTKTIKLKSETYILYNNRILITVITLMIKENLLPLRVSILRLLQKLLMPKILNIWNN